MVQIHHYSHATTPAGPGSDTVIAAAVQVDPEHQFAAAAALGEASTAMVRVDDAAAAYDFKGLWRWYVIENAMDAGDHYLWNGYVGVQRGSRGAGSGTMFPMGAGRRWELELYELSRIASFRAISDTDGNRPAETIAARLTWLLGTVYLPVTDNGLVVYDTTTLDANDYRGSFAGDVVNDMALRIGFNWWIYYDQSAASGDEVSLAFFDPASELYESAIAISNVEGEADGSTVFAPFIDAVLERDPTKIAAGVLLAYTGGQVYRTNLDTSYEFALQDQVAPVASVKTEAKANDLADRFLADNNEQDERVFVTIQMPSSQLNDIKHGQRLQVTFQHLPGYEAPRWCRVVRKTPAYPENRTQDFYDVALELSPLAGLGASAAYARGAVAYAAPTLPHPTTPGNLLVALVIVVRAPGGTSVAAPTMRDGVGDPDGGWAFLEWRDAYDATENQQPFWPTGSGIGSNAVGIGIAWRFVRPGEVTTDPMTVSPTNDSVNDTSHVWLYEFDTTTAPTQHTGYTNTAFSDGGPAAPAHLTLGSDLSGWVFGGLVGSLENFAMTPIITQTVGRRLRGVQHDNDPATHGAGIAWKPPWMHVFESPSGAAAEMDVKFNDGINFYNHVAMVGAAIVIPGRTSSIPAIPYPRNKTA